MKLTVIVHEAIEGGYWAEVPAIPGCATEGDSWDELTSNLHEAIEGCLFISETILQEDWLKPAEEVAWQDL
jgi:predicted RNase H-like HicB family nuclease